MQLHLFISQGSCFIEASQLNVPGLQNLSLIKTVNLFFPECLNSFVGAKLDRSNEVGRDGGGYQIGDLLQEGQKLPVRIEFDHEMDGRAEGDDDDNAKELHHLSHKRFFKSVFVKQSAQQSSFRRPEAGVGDLHHGVLRTDDLRAPDELVVLGVFHHGVRLAGHVLFVDEHLA